MLTWFSGIVLFAFIWFLTFLVVLTIRQPSQAETGEVTPGTPSSAPANPRMRLRLVITTGVAAVLFSIIAGIILSGAITLDDMDIYNRWLNG